MLKLGFIGAGTVGTALAVRLKSKGYPVVSVASRSLSSAERFAGIVFDSKVSNSPQDVADSADLIFITTPDDVIQGVAESVRWHKGQSVVHCSGALSKDILSSAKESGAMIGSFHPLQTFAGINQAIDNIPGSCFAIEADEPLLTRLEEIAEALECSFIELKAEDKVIYHAAAVFASNYLVTIVKLATDLWETFGVSPQEATKALLPLIRGTLNNIESIGIPGCLTGPIARGDAGTINKHLLALKKSAPDLVATYRELGLKTIPISLAKGKISREQAQNLERILK